MQTRTSTGLARFITRPRFSILTLPSTRRHTKSTPRCTSVLPSLSYGLGFAALTSTIVHVALFYGKDIWERSRSLKSEEADVHLKMMRKYREAPQWWFLAVFFVAFGMGMAASVAWDTHLPWWAFIFAIIIGVVFMLPVGVVQAITNQQTGEDSALHQSPSEQRIELTRATQALISSPR